MKKRAEMNSGEILVVGIISLIFCLSFFVAHEVSVGTGSFSTSFNFNQNSINNYNITINNTDTGALGTNVSMVYVALPLGFSYIFNSSLVGGNISGVIFSNTSNVLNWTNASTNALIFNQTNQSRVSFSFNATASTPGIYTFNISTVNSTGINNYTISVTINDTVAPNITAIVSNGTINNLNTSLNYIEINATGGDNGYINVINIKLFNSTGQRNSTFNVTSPTINSSVAAYYIKFPGLSDGNYYVNATVNDSYGNSNISSTVGITIDTTNPLIEHNISSALATAINVSVAYIFMSVNASDTNEKNITFNVYYPNGTALNSTTYTDRTRSINVTGMVDGNYTYNVTIYDAAANTNSTATRTITVDTINPNIDYGTGALANGSNLSIAYIYINVSASDTNEKNITFNIYNKTGSIISTTTYTNRTRAINVTTGIPDGNYTYNVTIRDAAGNGNSTFSKNVTIDTTAPTITLSCDRYSVNTGETITCTCTAADATSGLNGTPSYNSLPTTTNEGTFTTMCSAKDNLGNNGSSSKSYTVYSSSAAPGTGGGSTATKTYIPSATQLTSGYTNQLKSNERVKLTIASQTHYVAVTALTATSATISVSSTPQTATLNIGETKKFDVTEDGYYDLSVKLNGIKANKADITIKSIYEKIPATTQESTTTPAETVPEETTRLPEEAPKNLIWLWIIIGVIVVLILIWIIYKYKKR